MKWFLIACVALTVALSIQFTNAQASGQQGAEASVISAAQIRAMRASKEWTNRFVIVDVRAKAETDVSVIPGAITQAQFERTVAQHQGKVVLVYCTVGHRSGIYAKKLAAKGWRSYNYKGSILDWCKNNLSLVTPSGQKTKRVHTYNSSYKVAAGYTAVY